MTRDLLPPFERYRYELRLAREARFPFEHGGVLRGLLSRALERHRLPAEVVPFACEAGQVHFEAGAPYAFTVSYFGESRSLAPELADGLARWGGSRPRGPSPVLGGNFVVEGARQLEPPDLRAMASAWASDNRVELLWRSPLRLTRPEKEKRRGAGYFDRDFFPPGLFLDRLWRRLFQLRLGRFPDAGERASRPHLPPELEAKTSRLLWVDLPVRGTRQKARPYTLGGVRGRLGLEGVPEDWLPILAAGSLAHVGQGVRYGLGRYSPAAVDREKAALRPSRSLLERVASPAVLQRALEHVEEAEKAGARESRDGPDPGRLDPGRPEPEAVAERLARDLPRGRYEPRPLTGFVLPKKDGGVRPLAVPSFRDKLAQRGAVEVLAPALDTLLEDSSYAYRRGFSRQGAARAVERAYADGYRFVLDADIRAFFDQVDHGLLFAKLEALYPHEPLLELLRRWVTAPVLFDGRRLERRRGLPQGSPVSPMLANLYLDELDESLADQGFRLVRFADDFVVLARDPEEAARAKAATVEALSRLRLALNEDETAIRSIDDGFSYLGYLFVRSLVIEQRRARDKEPAAPVELEEDAVPVGSWLAGVPLERLEELLERGDRGARPRRGRLERVPLALASSLRGDRWPLYVTTPETRLFLRRRTVVAASGEDERELPLESLSHVVFCGRVRATVPVLRGLARAGVPSFFCRATGELEAVFGPWDDAWRLWLEQARAAADEALCLRFAASVIEARLRNLAVVSVRFGWGEGGEPAATLRRLAGETVNKTTLESLRGVEGRGAALVFAALAEALPEGWGFDRRARRPPPDPVNAMLSFGYSLLHHHAATALTEAGLSPRLGLFHQPRGAHLALASDLVEELRHLVESLVWTLIRRRQLQPGDFRASSGGFYPALLTPEGRKKFIHAFERRLLTELTPEGEDEALSYRAFLTRQAKQIRDLVEGRATRYRPLILRA